MLNFKLKSKKYKIMHQKLINVFNKINKRLYLKNIKKILTITKTGY
jgi:hypothetical protein